MNVAILDDYQDAVRGLDAFQKLQAHRVTIYHDPAGDLDDLSQRLRDAEAIVLIRERTPITESLIGMLPALRLISQTGKSVPHIDLAACARHGVTVCAAGRAWHTTVELTWALILAAMRRIPQEAAALRAGRWQTSLGESLMGRTLGVFGYGTIGSAVAKIGPAFGMRVRVWGRETSLALAERDGFEPALSKHALFAESDVVSLHVALQPDTRGIVNQDDLQSMKPRALFVNTSRAGLVQPGALVRALRAGRPGLAAIDVFDQEPVLHASDPLLQMDNVVATPHLGYVERGAYETFFGLAFDAINAYAQGKPINVVGT